MAILDANAMRECDRVEGINSWVDHRKRKGDDCSTRAISQ